MARNCARSDYDRPGTASEVLSVADWEGVGSECSNDVLDKPREVQDEIAFEVVLLRGANPQEFAEVGSEHRVDSRCCVISRHFKQVDR